MKNSKALMVRAGIYPRLKLGVRKMNPTTKKESVHSTGPHKVRVLDDKITKGRDRESGQIIDVMKYVLEVEGVNEDVLTDWQVRAGAHILAAMADKIPLTKKKQGE